MSSNANELQNEETHSNNNNSKNINTQASVNQSENKQILTTEIDLSEIDATEDNLQNYTFNKQFLKLDLDKIRDLIDILEEHLQTCIQKEDINLAKSTKQRIILLKKIEKEKMMIEAKIIYSNQRELVQDKMKEDLDNYLSNSNQEYENLLQEFNTQEKEMNKLHEKEIDDYKKNFEKNYNLQEPKPSKECLNWMKIKEYAIKQNKFNKAQEAEIEISKLKEKDNIKFLKNKEKKLNIELNKIMHKHQNEINAFKLKKKISIEEFNKKKNDVIAKIKKKYEAKLNELKNYQNFEISNFDKITKGVIKPCAKIQSIVSSTTGIKDEKENEEVLGNEEQANKEEDGDNSEKPKEEQEIEQKEKDNQEETEKEN